METEITWGNVVRVWWAHLWRSFIAFIAATFVGGAAGGILGAAMQTFEVKWTVHPTPGDARHLLTFLNEHSKRARRGYMICRCTAPLALTDRVTALPSFLL